MRILLRLRERIACVVQRFVCPLFPFWLSSSTIINTYHSSTVATLCDMHVEIDSLTGKVTLLIVFCDYTALSRDEIIASMSEGLVNSRSEALVPEHLVLFLEFLGNPKFRS